MAGEKKRDERNVATGQNTNVAQVVEEHAKIDKVVTDVAKVTVRKTISEEDTTVNIPLTTERYRVEHKAVNKVVEEPPTIRQEGDRTIIPVLREVLVIEKRYEILEEVHVIKETSTIPYMQEITLKKEHVHVDRESIPKDEQH